MIEQPNWFGGVGTGHEEVQFGTENCCSVSHSFPQVLGTQNRVPNYSVLRSFRGLIEQSDWFGGVGTGHEEVQFGTENCCSVSHSFPQVLGTQIRVPNYSVLRLPLGVLAFGGFGVVASRQESLSLDAKA